MKDNKIKAKRKYIEMYNRYYDLETEAINIVDLYSKKF